MNRRTMMTEEERILRLMIPEGGVSRIVVQLHGPDKEERLGDTIDVRVFEASDLELAPRPEKEIQEKIKQIYEHDETFWCDGIGWIDALAWAYHLSEEKKEDDTDEVS